MKCLFFLTTIFLLSQTTFAGTKDTICEVTDKYNFYKDLTKDFTFRVPCSWLNDNKSGLSEKGIQGMKDNRFSCRNDLTQEGFSEYVYCGTPAVELNSKPTLQYGFKIGASVRYGTPASSGKGCEKDSEVTIQDWGTVSSGKNYELSLDAVVICEI